MAYSQQHQTIGQKASNCNAAVDQNVNSVVDSNARKDAFTLHNETIPKDTTSNPPPPITFSRKAQNQRDADENLFLRFLELDPPYHEPTPSIASGGGGGGGISASHRRMSTKPGAVNAPPQPATTGPTTHPVGRTPFTITKKLSRQSAHKGFGFSIGWTHPPRVEKVEPGLSADLNGIQVGDYVIFIDEHNIVTMPEADVLNIIQAQGNVLQLEIFRKSDVPHAASAAAIDEAKKDSALPNMNGIGKTTRVASLVSCATTTDDYSPAKKKETHQSSTALSNISMETAKKKLHLPQVTFSKETLFQPMTACQGAEDIRRRILYQLISREQHFVSTIRFGLQRFVTPLQDRRDLISPSDHRCLFQNVDELMRISEDILEQLTQEDYEPQINFASRVYLSKTTAICAAYKKYCNGIKRADCVLVNKSRQPGSEFVAFITEPQVQRKRPDLTMFIHRPLQHFREFLKLMQLLSSHCRIDSEEQKNFTSVINELLAAYREITVDGGMMEPLGEGRPLLTLQDLESRLVFTRCKPFQLAVPGRQWIFGGDISRIEGRSIKQCWALLFSDILLFTKVSRDRVLFLTEEPLPISQIVDSCFNIRKKNTEFRLTVDPNGREAESPTTYCAPDISRTPKKSSRRKTLVLRVPTPELKAVWQNLLQRQIFLVNAAFGSTPLSSPLDSPDIFNTIPFYEIGAKTASMASMAKLSSVENTAPRQRNQQNASHQIELLIDEKCRILNKSGTQKGSVLHLANWMKGQLDRQSLAAAAIIAAQNQDSEDQENANNQAIENEEEKITFWTRAQLEKRTRELNLLKENGNFKPAVGSAGKRLSGVEELVLSDAEEGFKSPSRSTTSDSQITVRSSPIANNLLDNISVCRHCHKNCKQKLSASPSSASSTRALLSNSLKVQHSQSSPNRCCQHSQLLAPTSSTNSSVQLAISKLTVVTPSKIPPKVSPTPSPKILKKKAASAHIVQNLLANLPPPPPTNATSDKLKNGKNIESSPNIQTNATGAEIMKNLTRKTIGSYEICADRKIINNSNLQQDTNLYLTKNNREHPEHQQSPSCMCRRTLSPNNRSNVFKSETCKLYDDVSQLAASSTQSAANAKIILHEDCCIYSRYQQRLNKIETPSIKNVNEQTTDDLSLLMIGLAQLNPMPYTPGTLKGTTTAPSEEILSRTTTTIWDNSSIKLGINELPECAIIESIPDESPEDSPLNEEPPYRSLITSTTPLRRFGTLSSLEKVPSEESNTEIDELPEDADEENGEEAVGEGDDDCDEEEGNDESDIEIITKEVFGPSASNTDGQASVRNWTARAGSYVAEKMAFLGEEPKNFIDKYFGRWKYDEEDPEHRDQHKELMSQNLGTAFRDECGSGATSGEEVWGTPTSGGDGDDVQMLQSDQTQSSSEKSSASLTGDDDTELMMDELLMAPPMAVTTIRHLLPRRRLEPLFEEESESEDNTDQPDDVLWKKGETLDKSIHSNHSFNSHVGDAIQPYQPVTADHHSPLSDSISNSTVTSVPKTNREWVKPPIQPSTMASTATKTSIATSAKAKNSYLTSPSGRSRPLMGITHVTSTTTTIVSTKIENVHSNLIMTPTKKVPPPPPPRRNLPSTEIRHQTMPEQQHTSAKIDGYKADRAQVLPKEKSNGYGAIADNYLADAPIGTHPLPMANGIRKESNNESIQKMSTQKDDDQQVEIVAQGQTTVSIASSPTITQASQSPRSTVQMNAVTGSKLPTSTNGAGLSPRLEMRLALNHDIMGDEDLINFEPGPDLTAILGHDLSTYHRWTGRDLLSRSVNRIQPKETVISFCQQRNSKMDTPTLNRRKLQQQQQNAAAAQYRQQQQHPQIPNRNTWSSSAFVDQTSVVNRRRSSNSVLSNSSGAGSGSVVSETAVRIARLWKRNSGVASTGSSETKLTNLELLARQEKTYCASQSRNGSPAETKKTGMMRSSSLIEIQSAAAAGVQWAVDDRANKLLNLLKKRNSMSVISSSEHFEQIDNSITSQNLKLSPRKDSDKPPLNRRFWKHLTRRRGTQIETESIS